MRRRIDIACGLVVRPEVVFLDEPTTGLDPRSRQSIWELVSDFKEAGIADVVDDPVPRGGRRTERLASS